MKGVLLQLRPCYLQINEKYRLFKPGQTVVDLVRPNSINYLLTII